MAESYDERAARKAYMRRRQRLVFSITGMVMAVALVISLLFYYNVFGLGLVKTATVLPNYGVTAPCAPTDADGKTIKYTDNKSVSIRVFNGTPSFGFASAVAEALENRNFPQPQVDNYSSKKVERTTIYFGKNAIAQAYTLNSNFTDTMMVMDDREDMLIDVVLGATFNDLADKKDVPGTNDTIVNIKGCVAADKMTNLPKAIKHTPVNNTDPNAQQ